VEDAWDGAVFVGSGTVNEIVLSPDLLLATTTDDIAPFYDRLPDDLGGGSVGLAPFHVHELASAPVHNSSTPIPSSYFDAGSTHHVAYPVKVRFYGPFELGLGAGSVPAAVVVEMQNPTDDCQWFNGADQMFTARISTSEQGRLLEIGGVSAMPAKAGVYRAYSVEEGLLSKLVDGTMRDVVWPEDVFGCDVPSYVFTIGADCDDNGVVDPNPTATCNSNCACDFNNSGLVSATDIFIFLDAWFAQNGQSGSGLSADFNNSGNVNATDIFFFLDVWFSNNGMTCP